MRRSVRSGYVWVGTTVTMGGGGAVVIIEAFLIKSPGMKE
jgi:hypothetical protein